MGGRSRLVWVSVALVTLAIALATGLGTAGDGRRWLLILQLGTELNIATWWSGSLSLLAALGAWGHADLDDRRVRRGWLALALTLAVLSLTEVGSIHERLSDVTVIPFLLLLGGTALAALWWLWSDPSLRRTVMVVLGAFGLLAISVVQEHGKGYGTFLDAIPLMSVAVEEAIEVVVALIMWAAVATAPIRSQTTPPWHPLPDPLHAPAAGRVLVVLASAQLALAVLAMPIITIRHHGDPAVWFPSAAFLVLALDQVQRRSSATPLPRGDLWRAGWFVVSSAVMVTAVSSASVDRFAEYGLPIDARVLTTIVLAGALAAAWREVPLQSRMVRGGLALVLVGVCADLVWDLVLVRYVVVGAVPSIALAGRLDLGLSGQGPMAGRPIPDATPSTSQPL